MSDPLYKREILRLAADAHGAGELPGPHAHGTAHNPACGDKVEMDIVTDASGRIAALAHRTKACVLAQASAAILGREAAGLTRADIDKLHKDVQAMLADPGEPPPPPFDAYAAFEGATAFRNRHKCVLLPIEALLAAFEAKQE
jgi:NifU-like protein involved in Fe-S cluster formation